MAWTYEQNFNALNTADLNGQDSWIGSIRYDVVESGITQSYEGAKCVHCISYAIFNFITRVITGTTSGTVYFLVKPIAGKSGAIGANTISKFYDGGNIFFQVDTRGQSGSPPRLYLLANNLQTYDLAELSYGTWYIIAVEYATSLMRLKWKAAGGAYSAWTDWLGPYHSAFDGTIDMIQLRQDADATGTLKGAWDLITATDPEPEGAVSFSQGHIF